MFGEAKSYDHIMGEAKLQGLHPSTYRIPPKLITVFVVVMSIFILNPIMTEASWPTNPLKHGVCIMN